MLPVLLNDITHAFSLFCTFAGLVVFISPGIHLIPITQAIPFALDFWTAAGLIRLAGTPSWTTVLSIAVIVVIRKVATFGFRQPQTRKVKHHG